MALLDSFGYIWGGGTCSQCPPGSYTFTASVNEAPLLGQATYLYSLGPSSKTPVMHLEACFLICTGTKNGANF